MLHKSISYKKLLSVLCKSSENCIVLKVIILQYMCENCLLNTLQSFIQLNPRKVWEVSRKPWSVFRMEIHRGVIYGHGSYVSLR